MKIEKQDEWWRDAQHLSGEHGAHERKHKSEGRVDVEARLDFLSMGREIEHRLTRVIVTRAHTARVLQYLHTTHEFVMTNRALMNTTRV